jgi:hypothetical protein
MSGKSTANLEFVRRHDDSEMAWLTNLVLPVANRIIYALPHAEQRGSLHIGLVNDLMNVLGHGHHSEGFKLELLGDSFDGRICISCICRSQLVLCCCLPDMSQNIRMN